VFEPGVVDLFESLTVDVREVDTADFGTDTSAGRFNLDSRVLK
jgi:hypothetical protein